MHVYSTPWEVVAASRYSAVVLLNAVVDFFLLTASCRFVDRKPDVLRLLCGVSVGMLLRCVSLMHRTALAAGAVIWFLAKILSAIPVYLGSGKVTEGVLVYLTFSAAIWGSALMIEQKHYWLLLLCTLAPWAAGRLFPQKNTTEVRIRHQGKTVAMKALKDNGNTLRDPVSGETVIVVGTQPARELTGLSLQQLRNPLSVMESGIGAGYRLIPFSSVGKENGLMLAMRFPHVTVGNRDASRIVAFAPYGLDGNIQALTGGNVW